LPIIIPQSAFIVKTGLSDVAVKFNFAEFIKPKEEVNVNR